MYLRDLALYASDEAVLPEGRSQADFNATTHTPVEAYLDLLPRRKVELGDLAKVNIAVGPRGSSPAYFAALNVAILYWPRFDFDRYFELPRGKQQQRIIEVLHKALLQIADRTNSQTHWYEDAFTAIGAMSFPLPEISEDELSRRFGLLPRKTSKRRKHAQPPKRSKHG